MCAVQYLVLFLLFFSLWTAVPHAAFSFYAHFSPPPPKFHICIIYHYVINLDNQSFDGFWIRLAAEEEAFSYLNYAWPGVENCRRLPRHLTYMQFIGLAKGSASYYFIYFTQFRVCVHIVDSILYRPCTQFTKIHTHTHILYTFSHGAIQMKSYIKIAVARLRIKKDFFFRNIILRYFFFFSLCHDHNSNSSTNVYRIQRSKSIARPACALYT